MADYTFPDDLLQLQRDYYTADAKVEELVEADPDTLNAARAARLDLVIAMDRHEWWLGVDNRHQAKMALQAAARPTA